jgi:hypothetical protein
MTHATRLAIVREAKKERDRKTPYIWGGSLDKDPGTDCSGLVLGIWARLKLVPPDYDATAHDLFKLFPKTESPKGADLCFYGSTKKATHVTIYIGKSRTGVPMCIGANGGDHTVNTLADANRRRAFTRQEPVCYRSDFLGYADISPLGGRKIYP